jgi:hypothetical protein
MLNLPLSGKDILKCIEALMRKDFIKRDENDFEIYEYIA